MLSGFSRNRQGRNRSPSIHRAGAGRRRIGKSPARSSAGVGAVGDAYARREIVPIRRDYERGQPAIPGDRNRAGLTHARAVFINVIQALSRGCLRERRPDSGWV
jgi:hypothetical protein